MESSQILKISQMMGHILQLFVTLKDLGPFHGGLRLDISTAPGIINQIRLFFLNLGSISIRFSLILQRITAQTIPISPSKTILDFNSISSYFTINRSVFHKPNKWKEKNFHNPKIKSLPQLCYSTSIYLQSYALSRGGGSFAHFGEHIRY